MNKKSTMNFNTMTENIIEIKRQELLHNIKLGDVLLVNLGEKDGTSIQKGIRYVAVASNDANNKFSPNIHVVSFTSAYHNKSNLPTHHTFKGMEVQGLAKDSIMMGETLTVIPKDFVIKKVGHLTTSQIGIMGKLIMTQLSCVNEYVVNAMKKAM